MPRKLKFRPQITRVRLNPEQAVLACPCYDEGFIAGGADTGALVCAISSNGRNPQEDVCLAGTLAASS